jgi:hypothetical protein
MNQISIHEEVRSRLKSGNSCYHLVKNLLPSSLLLKNIKIKTHTIIILPAICMGVKLGHSQRENNG